MPASTRTLAGAGIALALVGTALVQAPPALAKATSELPDQCTQVGPTVSCTFTASGTFTVPATDSLHVLAVGGDGADGGFRTATGGRTPFGSGGKGAAVTSDIPLTGPTAVIAPGTVVTVTIGGDAAAEVGGANGGGHGAVEETQTPGTFYFGGGGGGATTLSVPGPESRIVVAPGGGGGGARAFAPGENAHRGGSGGHAVHGQQSGGTGGQDHDGRGGAPGIAGAAGAGTGAAAGQAGGATGQGGSGGLGVIAGHGGGGGGGYLGGGGGGGGARSTVDTTRTGSGGGGAAGTSYSIGSSTSALGAGDPRVVITYTDPEEPQTRIDARPATWVLTRSVRFGYGSDVAGGSYRCTVDGAPRSCGPGAVALPAGRAGTHRFGVAVHDPIRSWTDPTPAVATWTVPLDDRALTRVGRGWRAKSAAGTYRGTYLVSGRRGATLATRVRGARRIVLVAATGRSYGSVVVRLAGKQVRVINLGRRTGTKNRQLLSIATFATPRTGRLTITTRSGRPVRIDGLGVTTG